MLKKIVIGNWKMNPLSIKDSEKLFKDISRSISNIKKTDIIICPPNIYIETLKKFSKKISLGSQNMFWEESGAFTGEVSGKMLYNLGARYVILGHSERRALGENNSDINKKIKGAIRCGLIPILCVGEKERDENHEYLNTIKIELEECLNGVSKSYISKVIIAYEPIWAIGAGSHPASPEEFREMNIFIRKNLSDKFGASNIKDLRIIYGGSVDEKNSIDFIMIGKADGFLPGRASLKADKFLKIVQTCETSNK